MTEQFNPVLWDGAGGVVGIVEHYATQMGYNTKCGWYFDGPSFKPADRYLTEDGYPLGSEIWYISMEWRGYRFNVYGDSFGECAARAHAVICVLLPESFNLDRLHVILTELGKRNADNYFNRKS